MMFEKWIDLLKWSNTNPQSWRSWDFVSNKMIWTMPRTDQQMKWCTWPTLTQFTMFSGVNPHGRWETGCFDLSQWSYSQDLWYAHPRCHLIWSVVFMAWWPCLSRPILIILLSASLMFSQFIHLLVVTVSKCLFFGSKHVKCLATSSKVASSR